MIEIILISSRFIARIDYRVLLADLEQVDISFMPIGKCALNMTEGQGILAAIGFQNAKE